MCAITIENNLWLKKRDKIWTQKKTDSDGKASACNAEDPGSIPGLGRSPGEGNGNLLQYSCLEKSHGQRSLVS